jgi:outer membrane protein
MLRTVLFLFLMLAAAPAHALTVAIVDFERAVNETTEGKAAQQRLDTMYASRKAEIDKMRVDFEKQADDFQAKALILSDAARAEAEKDLIRKQQAFEMKYMQYQQEMQQTYLTLLSDLDEKMRALTERIAKEKSYDLVVDKAASVYAGGQVIDMTPELIQRYNAEYK